MSYWGLKKANFVLYIYRPMYSHIHAPRNVSSKIKKEILMSLLFEVINMSIFAIHLQF